MKRKDVMQFLKETETKTDVKSKSMGEKELKRLIDKAGELDREVKELTAELAGYKDTIKAYAAEVGEKKLHGNLYTAAIGGNTTTEIPFNRAFDYFKRHKLPIDGVFSVKVGEFKKIAGSVGLEDVGAKVEKTEFYSVSFK